MKPFRPILVGAVAAVLSACGGGGGDGGPPTITSVTISGDSTVVLKGTRQLTAVANAGGSALTTGVTLLLLAVGPVGFRYRIDLTGFTCLALSLTLARRGGRS